MKVNVHINFQEDIENLQRRAAFLLSSIIIKKLGANDMDKLIDILKNNSNK